MYVQILGLMSWYREMDLFLTQLYFTINNVSMQMLQVPNPNNTCRYLMLLLLYFIKIV